MDTLFSHVNIVTMNEQMTLWQDAFVGVTDGKIAYMAKKPPEEQPKKIIDATGMVLMPGLINMHVHLAGNGKPQKKQRTDHKNHPDLFPVINHGPDHKKIPLRDCHCNI